MNTLVDAADLDAFPGAPFDPSLVDVAASSIRADAGWHIAPELTETITVDSFGGYLLVLPTRRIVAVTAVRDVTTGSEVLTSWSRMSGGLYRRTGWPNGVLEVDLTHGYARTPLDLLPAIADYARDAANLRDPSVASRSVGQVSETYRNNGGTPATLNPAVARYAVPSGIA